MKRKKRISLVLLVMLVIWSFPMKVFAEGDVTPARDGPVKMGYYDDSGQWESLCRVFGTELRSFRIPLRVRRCDHMRLRFQGTGGAKLYSLTKILEKGSDL